MVKGIIFDADGTLIDSMWMWENMGERYLESKGIEPQERLFDALYCRSLAEGGEYIKEKYNIPDSPEQVTKDMLGLIEDFYRSEVELKTGIADYLEEESEKNIPMIVATSGDKNFLNAAFSRLGIDRYFKDILTCKELNTNKREPDIYLCASEVLGTKPEETAVFEDILHGIQSAKTAGFVTVGVEDHFSRYVKEEIITAADYYIKDYYDSVLCSI